MCEPVTATTAVYYMMAATAVTAVVGAVAAKNAANAEKSSLMYQGAVAENNAKTLEYQAKDQEHQGAVDLQTARRQNDQLKGAQRAAFSARGLSLNEGTPYTILKQTDYFGEVDQATIRSNTAKDAWATRVEAQNTRSDSGMLTSKSDSISPGRASTMSLLSSGASVASSWYGKKTG